MKEQQPTIEQPNLIDLHFGAQSSPKKIILVRDDLEENFEIDGEVFQEKWEELPEW